MTWAPTTLPVLLDDSFPLPTTLPFTAKQAEAVGVTRHVIARLMRAGLLRRVLKGVYVATQAPDDLLLRAQALALVVPDDAAVTDWTACWLHTGVLPPGDHLRVPPISIFRLPGQTRLRNRLCSSGERAFLPDDVMVIEGVRVTTPLRTASDIGRLASRDWALAGIDVLYRQGGFSKELLLANVERFRGQRGVVQLRELAPLADPRSESPGESVLRLRWLDLPSLPPPEPQISIRSVAGREIYRIDLGVEELRFGAEYDGEEHHSSDEDRLHDLRRRHDLDERFGWLVVPVRRADVFGKDRDIERILHDGVRAARRRLGLGRSPRS
jgi:hypothetical protein